MEIMNFIVIVSLVSTVCHYNIAQVIIGLHFVRLHCTISWTVNTANRRFSAFYNGKIWDLGSWRLQILYEIAKRHTLAYT